jgi:hypothetical protein
MRVLFKPHLMMVKQIPPAEFEFLVNQYSGECFWIMCHGFSAVLFCRAIPPLIIYKDTGKTPGCKAFLRRWLSHAKKRQPARDE